MLNVVTTRYHQVGSTMNQSARQQLASDLAESEAKQRQWLADVAHELRTPLAVVKAQVQAMLDGVRPLDSHNLGGIRDEIDHLTRLVESLHQISQAEMQRLKLNGELLDFAQLASDSADSLATMLGDADVRVQIDAPSGDRAAATAFVDRERMRQVLVSLFDNAARYAAKPARVSVACARVGDRLQVDVCDSGPGAPAQDLPYLFDRLYRGQAARDLRADGSGLGLAIVKALVEAHGGEVRAANRPGAGLCITLLLPTKPETVFPYDRRSTRNPAGRRRA